MAFILIILISLLLLSVIDPDSDLNHWRLDQPGKHKPLYKPNVSFLEKQLVLDGLGINTNKNVEWRYSHE